MIKLPNISGRELCKILEKIGFIKIHEKEVMYVLNIRMEEEQLFQSIIMKN